MSDTNVHSEKENKIRATGSIIYVTEKTMEIPKDAIKLDQVIVLDENGTMEIQAGDSKVNEDGTLEKKDGVIITMVNPKVFQALKENQERKLSMKAKAESKDKVQAGVDR